MNLADFVYFCSVCRYTGLLLSSEIQFTVLNSACPEELLQYAVPEVLTRTTF